MKVVKVFQKMPHLVDFSHDNSLFQIGCVSLFCDLVLKLCTLSRSNLAIFCAQIVPCTLMSLNHALSGSIRALFRAYIMYSYLPNTRTILIRVPVDIFSKIDNRTGLNNRTSTNFPFNNKTENYSFNQNVTINNFLELEKLKIN